MAEQEKGYWLSWTLALLILTSIFALGFVFSWSTGSYFAKSETEAPRVYAAVVLVYSHGKLVQTSTAGYVVTLDACKNAMHEAIKEIPVLPEDVTVVFGCAEVQPEETVHGSAQALQPVT